MPSPNGFDFVVRNGEVCRVASSQLVPGDIVLIEAGNQVPADLRLLEVDVSRRDYLVMTLGDIKEVFVRGKVTPWEPVDLPDHASTEGYDPDPHNV